VQQMAHSSQPTVCYTKMKSDDTQIRPDMNMFLRPKIAEKLRRKSEQVFANHQMIIKI
jgi:hypothetical protein